MQPAECTIGLMQDIVFVVEGDERYIRKHLLLDSLAEAEGIRNVYLD